MRGLILTTIRALPTIRHANKPLFVNLPPVQILVFEFPAVDGRPAGAVTCRGVTALNHELVDYAVKSGAFVGEGGGGANAQCAKAAWRNLVNMV